MRTILLLAAGVLLTTTASHSAFAADIKDRLLNKRAGCETLEFWFKADGTAQTSDINDDDIYWVSTENEVKWQSTEVEITIAVLAKKFLLTATPGGIVEAGDISVVH